jgi:hypothetical protein
MGIAHPTCGEWRKKDMQLKRISAVKGIAEC